MLDVTFNEDKCRVRKDNGARNMATLRHITPNTLKRNVTRKANLKRKRQMVAWNPRFLGELLEI